MTESAAHLRMEDGVEWKAFVPGDGIIYLGPREQSFMPSMFHEIRCIDIIRERIVTIGKPSEQNAEKASRQFELANHCINYLRQMVLCHGDLTLENVIGRPANAYGDEQVCWDWELAYHEAEKNQALHAKRK